MIERRFYPMAEMRMAEDEEDGQRRIVGYASVFNSMSEDLGGFRETVEPGFFDGVLGDDVRALYNHDTNMVLGRTASGTLELSQDELGLRFRTLAPNTSYARDLMQLIDRGDVNQASFSFITAEDEWEERADGTIIRHLVRAAQLFDVGPVTIPAYTATNVQMRSLMNIPAMPADVRGATASAEEETRLRAQRDVMRRHLDLEMIRR